MENEIVKAATDIIQPVFESSIVVAGHYAKACGRNTITSHDVQYALKFCARNLVGKHVGTLFPEDEDDESESESDEDEVVEVDEEEEPFTRYTGDDKLMNDIHQAVDTWDQWIPESPIECMLKDSVDVTY
jgi:histone H3/H4